MDPATVALILRGLEVMVPLAVKAGLDIGAYMAMRAQNGGQGLTDEQREFLVASARANVEKM